jgi:hypothetical protein
MCCEAAQRHGCAAAVWRDTEPTHPYVEGGRRRHRTLPRRVHFRAVPAHLLRTSPLGRHPLAVASSDVAGELRRRPCLPPAARASTGPRRAARGRPGHRAGRQHSPGPQPSVMGVSLCRRHRRSQVRIDRQGPSCLGRRSGIGESPCQRYGSERTHAGWRQQRRRGRTTAESRTAAGSGGSGA